MGSESLVHALAASAAGAADVNGGTLCARGAVGAPSGSACDDAALPALGPPPSVRSGNQLRPSLA